MSIYAKLKDILENHEEPSWKVSFSELERLIGAKLPASAFKFPGWWSNNPSNNAMTKIWLQAGFRTEKVDIAGRSVVFRRAPLEAPDIGDDTALTGFSDRPRNWEGQRAPERAHEASGFRDRQRPWVGPQEGWPQLETKSSGTIAENMAEARRRVERLQQGQMTGDDDVFENTQFSTAAEAALGRPARLEDFYGALKGMVTVAPDVDLTAPSDEPWEALKDT